MKKNSSLEVSGSFSTRFSGLIPLVVFGLTLGLVVQSTTGSTQTDAVSLDSYGNPATGSSPALGIRTPVVFESDSILVPTVVADAAGDQGSGPSYGDCLDAAVTNLNRFRIKVGQKVNGVFPRVPTGDIYSWSWRFDTDLNPNTGYQQFPYIGIEWEILIVDGGGFWTVNKWSQDTGYLPVPSAKMRVRHVDSGDYVFVTFDGSEIGRPTESNWITWNGYYPTWVDLAPDDSAAYWRQ